MRASLTQPPHWTQTPTASSLVDALSPGQLTLDEALDEARPFCPSCTSEDTVNYGPHWMDNGSDRWGCGLCGNEFLVVMS